MAAEILAADTNHGSYRITVVSNEFGRNELVTYDLDGGNPTRFGQEGRVGQWPAWSPDGTQIAFVRSQILVMNADGSNESPLTDLDGHKAIPTWSPDGKKIAFQYNNPDRPGTEIAEIWVVDVEGSEPKLLIREDHEAGHPAWSPDGTQIIYSAWGRGRIRLRLLDLETSRSSNLYEDIGGWGPAWSPDGRLCIFQNEGLLVVNLQGSTLRRLTRNQADGVALEPAWSPDGRYIAYIHHPKAPDLRGDLVIFDVVRETHDTAVKGRLSRGQGVSWKPFPGGVAR